MISIFIRPRKKRFMRISAPAMMTLSARVRYLGKQPASGTSGYPVGSDAVARTTVNDMANIPGPAEKDPAEGSREAVDRELNRSGKSRTPTEASRPPQTNPGDAAPAGTAGTGEAVCPKCQGSGRRGGAPCSNCGGSGKVIQAIGGA
jgi:hypothetical protein